MAMMHDDSGTDKIPECIQACVCVHGQRNECSDDINNYAHYVYVINND